MLLTFSTSVLGCILLNNLLLQLGFCGHLAVSFSVIRPETLCLSEITFLHICWACYGTILLSACLNVHSREPNMSFVGWGNLCWS